MATTAAVAFATILRVTTLTPCSAVGLTMKMSLFPSHRLTSLGAMSVSITFGTPNGSARITCVAVVVPTAPAHEMIPSHRPAACSSRILTAPARPTSSMAAARGAAKTSSTGVPVAARTSWSEMSAQSTAAPRLRSMTSGLPPCSATCAARKRISTPFVLHIPVTTIVGASLTGTSTDRSGCPAPGGSRMPSSPMMRRRAPAPRASSAPSRPPGCRSTGRAGILAACA